MAKKPAGGGNGSRWRRRVFTSLSALSLLLCVGVCVLWVRGYWKQDSLIVRLDLRSDGQQWWGDVRSRRGRVYLSYDQFVPDSQRWEFNTWDDDPGTRHGFDDFRHDFAGFRWNASRESPGDWFVGVPCWFLAALALLLPIQWFRRRLQVQRAQVQGLCPSCGYDLRGTPGRCPECGTVPDG